MKIGIIGAMPEETRVLKESLVNVKEVKVHHLTFILGDLYQHEIVLVQSGIGKVNAAIATTVLITQFKVDKVINTGSAGSLQKGLTIGDSIIATRVAYHDVDATAFDYKIGQVPGMPLYYESDKTLVDAAFNALQKTGLKGILSEIVSSDSFVANQVEIERIKQTFPNAYCTEMEGAAIAQTCYVFSVPFVVVRAISDSADENASMSFDEFIIQAGEKSAQMVLHLLEDLA